MLARIVNNVRRKLSNPLKNERINSWPNLIKVHNERKISQLSEYEKLNYEGVTDVGQLNQCVLRINHICQSCTIEDIANTFPNAVMIIFDKSSHSKFKSAFVGFLNNSHSIKTFLDADQLLIKGVKVVVTFADVTFEKTSISKSRNNLSS